MTTRRSAVSAISLMRWLETKTERPSAARPRNRFLTQRIPSGSRPFTGSSKSSTPWITEQRAGDAESLAHAERELAGALSSDVGQSDHAEYLVDPVEGMSLL